MSHYITTVLFISAADSPTKRSLGADSPQDSKRVKPSKPGTSSSSSTTDIMKPIDKQYCDAVVSFLLRIACQVKDFHIIND